jgi:D-glycero-D-manno-heptose 1,7-bisphosphate phosphatase
MGGKPAVFLDRDGTVIEDRGYLKDPSDIVFYSYSFESLRILKEHFLLFFITNQSGISKRITTEKEVNEVNKVLLMKLLSAGIPVEELFLCPHKTEDNCICKKPSPYFIYQAAMKYDLDMKRSYIIGDHPADIWCGKNGGIKPVYVLTGHGMKHLKELDCEVKICENLFDATKYIMMNEMIW